MALPDAPDPARGGTAITAIRAEQADQPDLLIRWGGFCGEELGGPLDIFNPAKSTWSSHDIMLEGSKSEPSRRSVHGLIPIRKLRSIKSENEEKEAVAIMFMGEAEGAPADLGHDEAGKVSRSCEMYWIDANNKGSWQFLDDVYALLRSNGSYSWLPIKRSSSGDSPTPRGWFGSDAEESEDGGINIVIYGGLSESNDRLRDAWILNVQ